MNIRSTRHAVWFGLLAGSLAIAPTAQAQIQITGGNTSGQAAFFVPGEDAAGNVRLFDVGLRTLRIETPNGVTTTSIFIPGAANFTDVDQSGTPNAGDTGTLQGTLSGIAFSGANPIPFTGRPTAINFTLDSFTNNIGNIEGTLIRPEQRGTAPLVFLPGVDNANITLGDSDFLSDGGELQLGDFEATLDSGLIALPSSLQFREGTGTPVTPDVSLARRIKFEFAGRNVLAGEGTDLDLTDDSFRFVGPANHRFRIQSVGTRASREFDIRGDIGAVDVTVEGPFDIKRDGTIDTDLPIERYSVRGDSEGLVSFFDDNAVGFSSLDDGDTRIEFRQGDNRLEARSEGSVDFLAVAGIDGGTGDDDFDDFDDFDGFDFSRIDFRTVNVNVNQTCNVCVTTLVPGRTVVIDDNRVTVGQPIVVTREGRSTRTATTFTRTTRLVRVTTTSTDLFTLNTGSTETARYQYGYLTGYRYFVIGGGDATVSRGQVVVRTISRGRNQLYVVTPSQSNQVLVAYSQVGPGSRIFPGLVGLREIASSDVVDDLDDLDDDTTEDLDLDDDFDSDGDDDLDNDDDLDDDSDDDDDDSDDDDDDDDDDSDDDDDDDDLDDNSDDDDDDSDDDDDDSDDDDDDDDDDLDDDSDDDDDDSDDDDDDDLDDDDDSDDDDDDDDSVTIDESSETIVIEETSGITGLSEIADDDTTSTDATSPNE